MTKKKKNKGPKILVFFVFVIDVLFSGKDASLGLSAPTSSDKATERGVADDDEEEEDDLFETEFRQYKRSYYMTKMAVDVVSEWVHATTIQRAAAGSLNKMLNFWKTLLSFSDRVAWEGMTQQKWSGCFWNSGLVFEQQEMSEQII